MFGFLMQCWYSYSYHNNQYIFGQGEMTCLRSSKRTLKPSQTKYPLGNHPNNFLMPYKVIPRYGLGANDTYSNIHRKNGENTKKRRRESKESKEIQERSPTANIIVGNYRLRRAERWENIPRVSSEVGEI